MYGSNVHANRRAPLLRASVLGAGLAVTVSIQPLGSQLLAHHTCGRDRVALLQAAPAIAHPTLRNVSLCPRAATIGGTT